MEKTVLKNVNIIIKEILNPFQPYIKTNFKNDFQLSYMIDSNIQEEKVIWLLNVARRSFLLQDSLLKIKNKETMAICGDIHGQFPDLLRIFSRLGFPDKNKYLFLGDYVDRGTQSIETMLLLICYKIIYPQNCYLLRGNHESADISKIYGFYDECKRKYNIKIWKKFVDVFNCLPLAGLVEDRIFCMHGGISPSLNAVNDILSIKRPCLIPDEGIICDLLWSDPDEHYRSGWNENERGVSFVFGTDVLNSFMLKNNLDLICRGHQVVEDGYEFYGKRKLVTIFSAPRYCNEFDNRSGVLTISKNMQCSFVIFK